MEDIYEFTLENDEFEKLLNGTKTVHLAINDPKRRVYNAGTQIKFVRDSSDLTEEQKVLIEENKLKMLQSAEIENLYYFDDVKEAVEILGKEACGFKQSATFDKVSDLFLAGESAESMEKNGIVAISFKLI
ncbi:MAG: hypothetical protein IJ538_04810 [Clostridia bacterium]|nr:hypothetical protein [Clostridia bacterium]